MPLSKKIRLDELLVKKGLASDQSFAQRLVMAGQVFVNGQMQYAPASLVAIDAEISLDSGRKYVSRGGEKLAAALKAFPITVKERICADVGASTGGFTDCLIQNEAAKVYAIDVGQGILDWQLRQDDRVVVMEGTNAREVFSLPEVPQLVTLDASFISLQVLLPVVTGWFSETGEVIALIKPQFEVKREQAARVKGVIRDPKLHKQVLRDILTSAAQIGYSLQGVIASPLLGPKGNREFLAYWIYPGEQSVELETWIDSVLPTKSTG